MSANDGNNNFNFNPDLLSKNYRMQMGIIDGIPTSSALTLIEYYTLYPPLIYSASFWGPFEKIDFHQ